LGSRPELLQSFQRQTTDQVDVTRVHQLQTIHDGQRRVDVWRVHVGGVNDGCETIPGDQK